MEPGSASASGVTSPTCGLASPPALVSPSVSEAGQGYAQVQSMTSQRGIDLPSTGQLHVQAAAPAVHACMQGPGGASAAFPQNHQTLLEAHGALYEQSLLARRREGSLNAGNASTGGLSVSVSGVQGDMSNGMAGSIPHQRVFSSDGTPTAQFGCGSNGGLLMHEGLGGMPMPSSGTHALNTTVQTPFSMSADGVLSPSGGNFGSGLADPSLLFAAAPMSPYPPQRGHGNGAMLGPFGSSNNDNITAHPASASGGTGVWGVARGGAGSKQQASWRSSQRELLDQVANGEPAEEVYARAVAASGKPASSKQLQGSLHTTSTTDTSTGTGNSSTSVQAADGTQPGLGHGPKAADPDASVVLSLAAGSAAGVPADASITMDESVQAASEGTDLEALDDVDGDDASGGKDATLHQALSLEAEDLDGAVAEMDGPEAEDMSLALMHPMRSPHAAVASPTTALPGMGARVALHAAAVGQGGQSGSQPSSVPTSAMMAMAAADTSSSQRYSHDNVLLPVSQLPAAASPSSCSHLPKAPPPNPSVSSDSHSVGTIATATDTPTLTPTTASSTAATGAEGAGKAAAQRRTLLQWWRGEQARQLRPLLPVPVNPRRQDDSTLTLTIAVNGCVNSLECLSHEAPTLPCVLRSVQMCAWRDKIT